jgi:peptidyl-prolyl cis-trans isomerase A (cyclophilin A)
VKKCLLFLIMAGALSAQQRPNGLYAIFKTSVGEFTAKLYEKEVPNTVENFVALAKGTKPTRDPKSGNMRNVPYYDNITFHRITPGQMIQAGDPTGTGAFDCGVTLRDEFLPGLQFNAAGRLGMANTGDPDTGGCQFFVTVDGITSWTGKYTVFGTVVDGMKVVQAINKTKVKNETPLEPVKLVSVTIERVGPEPVKKVKKEKEKK